jgi:cellulose synthase/poly-beta-1,6-N-acetylglucosamine synthase-like glycosyltransferase
MHLRIVMPTLGRSLWWLEAQDSASTIKQSEQVVVCTEEVFLTGMSGRRIRDKGTGLYAAVNTGLGASGDWAIGTYLNDDDRLIAAGIHKARQRLYSDKRIGAVFGRVHLINQYGVRITEIPVARRGHDLGSLLSTGIIPLAQPGTIFRRELFEGVGGFNESWFAAGDMEFFLRALHDNWRFEFVDASLAEFRVHPTQISQNGELVRRERDRLFDLARKNNSWRALARCAKLRFKYGNLGLYIARLRRHGFISMEKLYKIGGQV